jgi:squalene synthase HpnC
MTRSAAPLTTTATPITHYENFPVASWLCPPRLRGAITAIYHFARTADDLADEGVATPQQRLTDLAAYRADLDAICLNPPARPGPRWPQVFAALQFAVQQYALPCHLLHDLVDAFVQDVEKTANGAHYANQEELGDYCRRSANPVGRLLLHLYGVTQPLALQQSDAICTALQLINFWQDLSVDIPRGRFYVPATDCLAHGLDPTQPAAWAHDPRGTQLVRSQVAWARAVMLRGAGIVHRVPGRAGWELRAVVQGGLRILDKVEATGFDSLHRRPRITLADAPVILWRCLRMRAGTSAPMGQSEP